MAPRFPATRLRRLRHDAWTRRLVAENALTIDDLIWPIFLIEGADQVVPVASMPGVVRVTLDRLEPMSRRPRRWAFRPSPCSRPRRPEKRTPRARNPPTPKT